MFASLFQRASGTLIICAICKHTQEKNSPNQDISSLKQDLNQPVYVDVHLIHAAAALSSPRLQSFDPADTKGQFLIRNKDLQALREECGFTLSLISLAWLLTVVSRRVTRFIMADSSSVLLGGAPEHQEGEEK